LDGVACGRLSRWRKWVTWLVTEIVIDIPIDETPPAPVPPGLLVRWPEQTGKGHRLAHSIARTFMQRTVGTWGVLDMLMASSGFILAHALSPRFNFSDPLTYNIGLAAIVYAGLLICLNYAFALYDRHSFTSIGQMARSALISTLLALGATSLAFGWFGYTRIGRFILFDTYIISVTGIVLLRIMARELARWAKIRILFVGRRTHFRPLEVELRRLYRGFFHRPIYVEVAASSGSERARKLLEAITENDPEEIVVEEDNSMIAELLRQSPAILGSGAEIRTHVAICEDLLGQIPVDYVDYRGILGGGLRNGRYGLNLIKRGLDIALAMLGLAISAPAMLVVAVAVKLTSRGPIFYTQKRVGRFGRIFAIHKFRTMRLDAEKNGAVWASNQDPRVTPIGGLLRKSRLDELPQFWNILVGDMSFVGPRPERPEFVETLRDSIPYYDLRHLVPPGLTGWAQVRYRYGASMEDAKRKLAYDLYYVRHYSPSFDLAICLRTLMAMARGAR
jgi:exopolysaccharide biosynthesis polyprenyl glycosylphosphotransferase